MTPSEPRLRGLAWICRRDPRRRSLMLPVLAGSMLCGSSAALAQSSDAPVKRVVPPADATMEGPAPLLREGGLLLEVPGRIERNQDLGVHVYRPDPERTGGIRRELILLPSRGLDDLARIEEVRERLEQDPMAGVFEVSGRVLVYQGRNFLLPESIVPVVDVEVAPDETEATNSAESVDEDDIADDLESRLEARIGAVPRSLDLEEAAPTTAAPVRPGTRFVDRRGHLSRDPESGVWRFVPSGDTPGVGGIVLLPCLELQRIERSSRQRDVSEPLLVSGLVTAYRGRNYLLPSAVKAAVEGRGIGP